MSKRKHYRQKPHGQEKTNQRPVDPALLSESGNPEAKQKDRAEGEKERDDQSHIWMGLKERIKASSTTDWLLVFFTGVLAVFTIFQFVIIGHQLDVMRKDERGWLNVRADFIPPDTIPTVTGTIKITNSGKTPALHIEVNALIEVVPNGQEPHFGGEAGVLQHLKVTTGALSPNSPADLPITRRKDGQEYPLTDAEITDLKEGKTWIAIHGRTTYKDVFKVPHWTQFCVWHGYATDPNAKLSAFSCTEYNSVDEQ